MYNLWKTIVASLQGLNSEGSSKRVAAAWILIFTGVLDGCYGFSFVYSTLLSKEELTSIHTIIVNQWEYTLSANFFAAASYLGITYFDKKLDTKKEVELKKAESL